MSVKKIKIVLLLAITILFIAIILWNIIRIISKNSNEGFEDINKFSSSPIPRKVFMYWHTKDLPPKMRENIESMKKQNPEFEFFLYDTEDCRAFIKDNFDGDVLDAYDRLIPLSYKSDLWRFCVMYIHGGIYLDIKMKLISEKRLVDLVDKEHFVKDRDGYFMENEIGIMCGVLINKAKNPLFMDCIRAIINNVKTDNYGYNSLYPTGPGLIGLEYKKNKEKYGLPDPDMFHEKEGTYVQYQGKRIFGQYPEYRSEQTKQKGYKSYGDLWNEKKIYKENLYSKEGFCDSSSPIPRKVFMFWHTKKLPPKMRENVKIMMEQNPEFDFFLYDMDDCRAFIKDNFNRDVLYAYDSLVPYSYKSDLWRFCVMYIHGGIYLDIKMKLISEKRLVDLVDKEHFVKDRDGYFMGNEIGIYCAILINKQRNPLFMDCIRAIVKNVKNNYYGYNSLYPTGPGLIGLEYKKNKEKYGLPDPDMFNEKEGIYVKYKGKRIFGQYPEYRSEQTKQKGYKSYGQLWNEKKIYTTPKTEFYGIRSFIDAIIAFFSTPLSERTKIN